MAKKLTYRDCRAAFERIHEIELRAVALNGASRSILPCSTCCMTAIALRSLETDPCAKDAIARGTAESGGIDHLLIVN